MRNETTIKPAAKLKPSGLDHVEDESINYLLYGFWCNAAFHLGGKLKAQLFELPQVQLLSESAATIFFWFSHVKGPLKMRRNSTMKAPSLFFAWGIWGIEPESRAVTGFCAPNLLRKTWGTLGAMPQNLPVFLLEGGKNAARKLFPCRPEVGAGVLTCVTQRYTVSHD